jgi:hypothetical protein
MMGARFKRHIGGCATRQVAGLGQRLRLGMRAAAKRGHAAADDDRSIPFVSRRSALPTDGFVPVRPSCQRAKRMQAAMKRRSRAFTGIGLKWR